MIGRLRNEWIKPLWYQWGLFYYHRLKPAPSYAQHGEDLVLGCVLGQVRKFIDVGANNGISLSNSFHFALQGASGLLFEPTPEAFKWLSRLYRTRKNLICINEGLSNRSADVDFRISGFLSFVTQTEDLKRSETDAKWFDDKVVVAKLPVKPLSLWLEKYPQFRDTDFVSLDVEGHELAVLQGIDFDSFRTKCFVIETHGGALHRDYSQIAEKLNAKGYAYGLRGPLNSFWFHESVRAGLDLDKAARSLPGYTLDPPTG